MQRKSLKRGDVKRVEVSESGLNDVSKAKNAMGKYTFMAWYEPHIREKRTISNVNLPPKDLTADEDVLRLPWRENNPLECSTQYSDVDDIESIHSDLDSFICRKKQKRDMANKIKELNQTSASAVISISGKPTTSTSIKPHPVKSVDISKAELEVMETMKSVLNKRLQRVRRKVVDKTKYLGKIIARELSLFNDDLKFQVKHDLNKVIYEYRLKQQQQTQLQLQQKQQTKFQQQHAANNIS